MIAALIIWVGLYYYLLDSGNAMLNGLAPHFEAISFGGICVFVVSACSSAGLPIEDYTRTRRSDALARGHAAGIASYSHAGSKFRFGILMHDAENTGGATTAFNGQRSVRLD